MDFENKTFKLSWLYVVTIDVMANFFKIRMILSDIFKAQSISWGNNIIKFGNFSLWMSWIHKIIRDSPNKRKIKSFLQSSILFWIFFGLNLKQYLPKKVFSQMYTKAFNTARRKLNSIESKYFSIWII